MDSILIMPKTEREYSFVMEMLKRMKIKAKPVHEPTTPMTMEKYREMIDFSLAEAQKGHVISHEDVKKQVKQWP